MARMAGTTNVTRGPSRCLYDVRMAPTHRPDAAVRCRRTAGGLCRVRYYHGGSPARGGGEEGLGRIKEVEKEHDSKTMTATMVGTMAFPQRTGVLGVVRCV